jgi:hypothetical protein
MTASYVRFSVVLVEFFKRLDDIFVMILQTSQAFRATNLQTSQDSSEINSLINVFKDYSSFFAILQTSQAFCETNFQTSQNSEEKCLVGSFFS